MITFSHKGNFSKTTSFLEKAKNALRSGVFDKYGNAGVNALSSATPVDTGATAASWRYEVETGRGASTLSFYNDNIQNGLVIAIILQYGHGTGTGGWVSGRDYINPAIQPVFDKIAEDLWREVIS